MFSQASRPVRLAVVLIVANWIIWGAYSIAIGGEALMGEISNGVYLIRIRPNSRGVSVSSAFWIFSLVYTFLTVGGSILALALLYVFHRPRWDRGALDTVALVLAAIWILMLFSRVVPRLFAWAAA